MLNLAELNRLTIDSDDDLLVKLAIDALYSVKAHDEHLRADRRNTFNWKGSIADYGHFWYSHLYEGGCYNFALTIDIATIEDMSWIHIIPSPSLINGRWAREDGTKFDIRKPDNALKTCLREVLDKAKKSQDRKPFYSPWDERINGPVAQIVERPAHNGLGVSASLTGSTKIL